LHMDEVLAEAVSCKQNLKMEVKNQIMNFKNLHGYVTPDLCHYTTKLLA